MRLFTNCESVEIILLILETRFDISAQFLNY